MIDESLISNFKKWFESYEKSSIPTYEDLPNISLYMDQLISYLKRETAILETSHADQQITSSMINNYVKAKIVDKPNKKKYSKEQMAELIEIIYLKKVLSISEIKQIINTTYETTDKEKAYNEYVDIKKQATKKAVQDAKIQLNDIDYKNKDAVINASLDLAAKANAYAIISKMLLHMQNLLDYSETKDEVIEKALKDHTQNKEINVDNKTNENDLSDENDL